MLGGSPVPSFYFPSEVKEWSSNFRVVWDKVPIIAREAKELANFGQVSWDLPSSYAIKFARVHAHLVLSDNYPQVLDLVLYEFTFRRLEIKVIIM